MVDGQQVVSAVGQECRPALVGRRAAGRDAALEAQLARAGLEHIKSLGAGVLRDLQENRAVRGPRAGGPSVGDRAEGLGRAAVHPGLP